MVCDTEKFDMRRLGLAIKQAREAQGLTRNQAGEMVGIEGRYLTNIENKGQHPSLQVFYRLVTLFHISVDQYFYTESEPEMSTRHRQVKHMLEALSESDMLIVSGTIRGILEAKEADDG